MSEKQHFMVETFSLDQSGELFSGRHFHSRSFAASTARKRQLSFRLGTQDTPHKESLPGYVQYGVCDTVHNNRVSV